MTPIPSRIISGRLPDDHIILYTCGDMLQNDFYVKCLNDLISCEAKKSSLGMFFYTLADNINYNLDKVTVFLQTYKIENLVLRKILHNIEKIKKQIITIKNQNLETSLELIESFREEGDIRTVKASKHQLSDSNLSDSELIILKSTIYNEIFNNSANLQPPNICPQEIKAYEDILKLIGED